MSKLTKEQRALLERLSGVRFTTKMDAVAAAWASRTKEQRRKILRGAAEKKRGVKWTAERRQALSQAVRASMTAERRAKISAQGRGRKYTPAAVEARRESMNRVWEQRRLEAGQTTVQEAHLEELRAALAERDRQGKQRLSGILNLGEMAARTKVSAQLLRQALRKLDKGE